MTIMLAQSDAWAGVDVTRHLFLFSPMLTLICTMLAVVACPIIVGRSAKTIGTVAVLGIIASFILALRVAGEVASGGASGLSTQPGEGLLLVDNLSIAFQLILLVFMGGVTWLWWMGSSDSEENAPEFFILLIGSAVGMALMVSTSNLLMIALAIETASLPSYAMVGFDKRDRRGAEASLKYLIFGAISAAIMLYGISLLYGLSGSLSVAGVAHYCIQSLASGHDLVITLVALMCVLAGIGFKVSAVPFHFWCPDAFEGAKVEVTTWLSVASKAAALILLARLVMVFCAGIAAPEAIGILSPLAWGIGIMAAITCTVGNFAAYVQTSAKRLLAYSSIAHAGYMLMAVAIFVHPHSADSQGGISALLTYIAIYMFMNLGAFGVVAMIVWDTGNDNLSSFTGLLRRAPMLAIPMIICLVSLVGLPPFAGFIGKWWILIALGQLGSTLGWFLVIVAVFNTLISLYYYMRIVVKMALREDGQPVVAFPLGGMALVNFCAVALLVMFVFAQPLKTTSDRFTRNIFHATVEETAVVDASATQPIENVQR